MQSGLNFISLKSTLFLKQTQLFDEIKINKTVINVSPEFFSAHVLFPAFKL